MNALHDLVAPLSPEDLLEASRSATVRTCQTAGSLFRLLQSTLTPEYLPEMVRRSHNITAWFRNRDGGPEQIAVKPDEALRLHSAGMTLYGKMAPAAFPTLSPVYEAGRSLTELFGVPPHTFSLSYFASCAGGRTLPHFDRMDVMVVHLYGKKRWRLAKNTDAPASLLNFYMGAPSETALRAFTPGPMPTEMPEERLTIDLTPGTLLFVPRGTWHETWTEEASLSLDLTTMLEFYWRDLITSSCRRVLTRTHEARLTATPTGDRKALAASLQAFQRVAAALRVDDFFPPSKPRPPLARLAWNPLATSFIESLSDTHAEVIFECNDLAQESPQIKLTLPWLAVIRELSEGASFSAAELEARGIHPGEVKAVLNVLWREGILREEQAASGA